MTADLRRVETTLCALSVGIAYEWSENHVMAHGLSGQRNPLGYALDHLLSNPNHQNAGLVAFLLATELVKRGVCSEKDSVDSANDALAWWYDSKCTVCHGRGVLNFEQVECPGCLGSGRRDKPSNRTLRESIGVIESSMDWMEGQLRKRLTSGV